MDASDRKHKDDMLTQTGILLREGWSKTLITKLLGEPDLRKKVFGRSIQCCLYKLERIIDAEKSIVFANAQEILIKRREAARKAVATKEQKLLAEIEAMKVSVTLLPLNQVRRLAIDSYNYFNIDKNKYASLSSDSDFLDRISVNFIRHELTEYDHALYEIAGKTGISLGVSAIRDKIYSEIYRAYPFFEAECTRQRQDRAYHSAGKE